MIKPERLRPSRGAENADVAAGASKQYAVFVVMKRRRANNIVYENGFCVPNGSIDVLTVFAMFENDSPGTFSDKPRSKMNRTPCWTNTYI